MDGIGLECFTCIDKMIGKKTTYKLHDTSSNSYQLMCLIKVNVNNNSNNNNNNNNNNDNNNLVFSLKIKGTLI